MCKLNVFIYVVLLTNYTFNLSTYEPLNSIKKGTNIIKISSYVREL